jgi:TRAP-type C4-dicarboxylate transport system permease large subunit
LIVGRLTGNLSQVNIVSSMIFAGITGTAVANAAAIGGILIRAMKEVFVYCRFRLPFWVAEITVLFLITYIPELILFVPRIFGFVV